jgi:hypothetical protein
MLLLAAHLCIVLYCIEVEATVAPFTVKFRSFREKVRGQIFETAKPEKCYDAHHNV